MYKTFKENKKLTEMLAAYKKELAELYTKAVAAARAKKVDEYRQILKAGELTEAERQRYTDLIVSPDAIATELLDVDYGENADRVAELATFIQHPEMVEEQSELDDFIKRMEGFAQRNAPKELLDADRAAAPVLFTQHSEMVDEQTEQENFIKFMEGYAKRNARKE